MRSNRRTLRHPTLLTAMAAVLLVGLQVGCSTTRGGDAIQPMQTSAGTPAARGTVEADAGDNGNTQLDVRVEHLAAPSKLADDASVFVVWIKPKSGPIQNVGALEVDGDLSGRLETTTPHKAFTVSVTPEPSARMARPTHAAVFTSEVNRTE